MTLLGSVIFVPIFQKLHGGIVNSCSYRRDCPFRFKAGMPCSNYIWKWLGIVFDCRSSSEFIGSSTGNWQQKLSSLPFMDHQFCSRLPNQDCYVGFTDNLSITSYVVDL